MRVITSATGNAAYLTRALAWAQRFQENGHTVEVVMPPWPGSWIKATHLKPVIIERAVRSGPVLWLDADSVVVGPGVPALDFGGLIDVDFAAVEQPSPHPFRASALFFNHTQAAKALLDEWLALCNENPDEPDHPLLVQAWRSVGNCVVMRTAMLGQEWSWMPGDAHIAGPRIDVGSSSQIGTR